MGKLIVSSSPHIRSKESVSRIMWSVIAALMPAVLTGLYVFGLVNLKNIVVGVSVAVLTEALCQRMMHRKITVDDGSAIVTGLLLVMVLPPGLNWWIVAAGSFFAIAIVKQLFGGLGHNIFNPALTARAVLLVSFPIQMTRWLKPFDSLTAATPLAVVKDNLSDKLPMFWDLFIGKTGGSFGETGVLALLAGAAFLFLRKIISWHIPFSYLGVVALLSWIFGRDPLFSILAGGLILGAFFMATDPATTPLTKKGQIFFGVGCGIITVAIRQWGGYPEGVCYSILLMNALTPLIDRYLKPRRFGVTK
ncbi:MAG: RnfABCDGE type electron transport complex subunit D [Candidatus Omnitrophota bacterium]|nr:RnfABCDGE type electron transport complex subunit D [Candidatus Omnitrophota bacterium]